MALTLLQARDKYLLDSVCNFLVRRIKSAYDAEAALTGGKPDDYSKPLKIMVGHPDDPNVLISTPVIAVDMLESVDPGSVEVGTSTNWRCTNFVFYCYPSVNANGAPSYGAAMLMRAYMRDAFGGVAIQIIDYSNNSYNPVTLTPYCGDVMYIVKKTAPMNRGQSSMLAMERHRFDVHLEVKYAVMEGIST